MTRRHQVVGLVVLLASLAACSGGGGRDFAVAPPTGPQATAPSTGTDATSVDGSAGVPTHVDTDVTVTVRPDQPIGPVSPLTRGFSGDVDAAYLRDVGGTVNSWGGNPSSRFNYEIGHAWNNGADWEFRNTNYGHTGDEATRFIQETTSAGAQVRLAVPTLGWIPKNDDNATCSFPSAGGGCAGGAGANCQNPGVRTDPTLANEPSDPGQVRAWVQRLLDQEHLQIGFVAMDNEPELWGFNQYDIHPSCTTYEEVLDRYLTYATALREVAPDAKFMGPVMCCWFDYWRIAPGTADGEHVDFLTWFLQGVRAHDESSGGRTLDVVDVHYYPQSDVYNDNVDAETAARRLRSTRSLWDPSYVDESWINERIRFIPRMRDTIASAYPGTPLAISEWNFGADGTQNGALAIADVLGIYGREGVYLASYWRSPKVGSPGYFAFKMHGNYDDQGSSFTGTALPAETSDLARVGSYAVRDDATGHLKLLLLNKDPDAALTAGVDLRGFAPAATATVYRYSDANPGAIVHESMAVASPTLTVALPPYSITVVDLPPAHP